MIETIHAPDCDDLLESAPLCGIEDPEAVQSFTLADVNCPLCRGIVHEQPGLLARFVDVSVPEATG